MATTEKSDGSTDSEDEKSVGSKTYKQFLGTIRANVGGVQPPMVAQSTVGIILCTYGDRPAKTLQDAIIVGRDQKNDIIQWVDADGRKNIGLRLSAYEKIKGGFPYDMGDVDAIEDIIQTEISREETNKEVIGWGNTQIMEIENRYGEEDQGQSESDSEQSEKEV